MAVNNSTSICVVTFVRIFFAFWIFLGRLNEEKWWEKILAFHTFMTYYHDFLGNFEFPPKRLVVSPSKKCFHPLTNHSFSLFSHFVSHPYLHIVLLSNKSKVKISNSLICGYFQLRMSSFLFKIVDLWWKLSG